MATKLATFLEARSCAGRKERPVYFPDGDFVTFYFADDPAFEDRADELVTLYRSFGSRDLVGCKIKGVRNILSKLGDFGVLIKDQRVALGLLFIGAALANPARRDEYQKIGRQYGELEVETKDILAAA